MDHSVLNHKTMCVAHAARVVGDKWTPLLINALSDGSLRFCALQDQVGGINPRTLSARLDYLEEIGVLTKRQYAEMPPRVEYSLTPKGQDLIPILKSMASWGDKYPK